MDDFGHFFLIHRRRPDVGIGRTRSYDSCIQQKALHCGADAECDSAASLRYDLGLVWLHVLLTMVLYGKWGVSEMRFDKIIRLSDVWLN
jgi:hypothetical protein